MENTDKAVTGGRNAVREDLVCKNVPSNPVDFYNSLASPGADESVNAPGRAPAIRPFEDFSDEDLQAELERREWVRNEIQTRIYRGELEATDADGVVTMTDLQ